MPPYPRREGALPLRHGPLTPSERHNLFAEAAAFRHQMFGVLSQNWVRLDLLLASIPTPPWFLGRNCQPFFLPPTFLVQRSEALFAALPQISVRPGHKAYVEGNQMLVCLLVFCEKPAKNGCPSKKTHRNGRGCLLREPKYVRFVWGARQRERN